LVDKAQTPLLRFVVDLLYSKFITQTRQSICVVALVVMITSPTPSTLSDLWSTQAQRRVLFCTTNWQLKRPLLTFNLEVACNNNMPTLQDLGLHYNWRIVEMDLASWIE